MQLQIDCADEARNSSNFLSLFRKNKNATAFIMVQIWAGQFVLAVGLYFGSFDDLA